MDENANKFIAKMRERSNFELYKITTSMRDNYQAAAVEAAEVELKERNLSPEDINSANAMLEVEAREKARKKERSLRRKILDRMSKDPASRTVRTLIIFVGLVYLVNLISSWSMISTILLGSGAWDASILEFMAPLVLTPIGLFGLYNGQQYGWIILTLLLGFYALSGALVLIQMGLSETERFFYHLEYPSSQLQTIDSFSWLIFSFYSFLFNGLPRVLGAAIFLLYLQKPYMTERFAITKEIQIGVLTLSGIVSVGIALFVFNPF